MNTPILYIFYAKLQYTPYTAHTSSLTIIIPHLLMIYIDDRHINHARAPQCCNPDPRCRPETYCPGPGLQVDGSLLRTTAVSTCCSVPTPPQSLNPGNRSPETRRHPKHGESHAGGEYHNVLTAAALRAQVSPQYWNPEICESGPRDSGTVGREQGWRCAVLANEIGINSGPPTCRLKERSEGRGSLGWDDSGRAPHYCETPQNTTAALSDVIFAACMSNMSTRANTPEHCFHITYATCCCR
jgi:hypothetical protein